MFRLLPFLLIPASLFGQNTKVTGTYQTRAFPKISVTFHADSTFQCTTTGQHPTFNRWEDFAEDGRWTVSGDTVILNPQLALKAFVESELIEETLPDASRLRLTFNHIKRFLDGSGKLVRTDTLTVERLDYAFNELKKRNRTRLLQHAMFNCTFAGYIPKEVIHQGRTIIIPRPASTLTRLFVASAELLGTREYPLRNPSSNHLTVNMYSNYYLDGQLRQVKYLMKNDHTLYTRRNNKGGFDTDSIWSEAEGKLMKAEDRATVGNTIPGSH